MEICISGNPDLKASRLLCSILLASPLEAQGQDKACCMAERCGILRLLVETRSVQESQSRSCCEVLSFQEVHENIQEHELNPKRWNPVLFINRSYQQFWEF